MGDMSERITRMNRETFTVNRGTENCSGLIYQTDNILYHGIEVLTPKNKTKSLNPDGRQDDTRILFTSDAYEPKPGDWYGIRFANTRTGADYATDGRRERISGNHGIWKSGYQDKNDRSDITCDINKTGEMLNQVQHDKKAKGLKLEIKDWVVEYATNGIEIGDGNEFEIKDSRIDFCSDYGMEFIGNKFEAKNCSLSNNKTGIKISAQNFTLKDFVFTNNKAGIMVIGGKGTIKDNKITSNDTGLVIVDMRGDVKENLIKENGIGIYLKGEAGENRGTCPVNRETFNKDEILKQSVNQVQGMVQNDKENRDGALYIGKENVFEHNFLYHIYNNTPDTIDARHNYWYPPEPESIEYYIYDYYDDPNLGVVIYEPIDRGITGGPQGDEMPKHIIVNFGSSPTNCLSITYNLLIPQKIEISVYDACGRLVSKEQGMKEKGRHNFVVSNIASGVYFVKFDCSGIELKKKFILVR